MPRISPFVEQEMLGISSYVYTENSENIDDLAGLLIDTGVLSHVSPFAEKSREVTQWQE